MSEITSWLPHRPPFLFLDEVWVDGDAIRASRVFNPEEWFFKGHFPKYPVVPGVLLVETLAQAGGVGVKMMGIAPRGLFVLAKIRSASFRRQVKPGERLDIEIRNIKASPSVIHQAGTGYVDGQKAVEAEWLSMATGVPE